MKRTERKSHEEWLQIISDQEHSGQDMAEYCEQRGLSANRFVFHRWGCVFGSCKANCRKDSQIASQGRKRAFRCTSVRGRPDDNP